MASSDDKVIPQAGLTKVRHALYDAKLALESGFEGDEKRNVIRTILEALDATANLTSVVPLVCAPTPNPSSGA